MRIAAIVVPLLLAGPVAAATLPPPPLCGRPEVLQEVADLVVQAGQRTTIEPGSAGEVPVAALDGRPDRLLCGVRLHTLIYDTSRFGQRPVDRVTVYEYTLELRHNGVFLQPGPGVP